MDERQMVSRIVGVGFRKAPEGSPRRAAEFLWYADDPLAVVIIFHDHIQWTFARDLLAEGQYVLVGDGDVRVGPITGSLDTYLMLRSPDGCAEFDLDGDAVADFLAETEEIVPLGAERYEITEDDLREMETWG